MKSLLQITENILTESAAIVDINNAIDNKKIVKINYLGDQDTPRGERFIEPYLIGRTVANNLAIRAFQTSGVTKTFQPDWKIFLISKIDSWEEQEQVFETRSDYNSYGDKMFKIINKKI